MHQIIKHIPRQRQTILFSATQTKKVEDLARLSMNGTPIYTGVHDDAAAATVEGLQQGYVLCPAQQRFLLLFTFLKKNKNKKIMVLLNQLMLTSTLLCFHCTVILHCYDILPVYDGNEDNSVGTSYISRKGNRAEYVNL